MSSNQSQPSIFQFDDIAPGDLRDLIDIIYTTTGIALNESKKELVAARLHKRLRALGLATFKEYVKLLHTPKGSEEICSLVDVITTNTTHFFREPRHFDVLRETALPTLCRQSRFRIQKRVYVWSAGCSFGAEPYTLAMTLADYFTGDDGDYSILATDISRRVLTKARQGIYPAEEIGPHVPPMLKYRYLMQGKGSQTGNYRLVPELRERVDYRYLNLMDEEYQLEQPFDIIFCRNVIIYFDEPTRITLIRKFYDHLAPGGYLFIGHSETLHGINNQMTAIEPTVYRKTDSETGALKSGREPWANRFQS